MRLFYSWILLVTCSIATAVSVADVTEVDNQELKSLMASGVPVIDVRRPDEWQKTGIVENSYLLTFFDSKGRYDVRQWLAELDKIAPDNQPFVLICAVGGRTGNISRLLDKKLGYSAVHNVTRGINHWIKSGESTVHWTP